MTPEERAEWKRKAELHKDYPMAAVVLDLIADLEAAERWKKEAHVVLSEWEDVWETAGRPGRLGSSKASGVKARIKELETSWAVVDPWRP